MLTRTLAPGLAGLFLLIAVSSAAAEPPPRYNTVALQAEAQRAVQNDLLEATLYIELSNPSPAALANAINRSINEALQIAKDYKDMRVSSGNAQTYPVYAKDNTLKGWRGRAEIRIESKDFEAAADLIGKLQATMQLGSMSFSVSPEKRYATENQLIAKAISAFKERAEIVRAALAGRGYKLQHLNLAAGYNAPQPRFAMALRAKSAQEPAAPSLEAGVSMVTVTASGTIEILE